MPKVAFVVQRYGSEVIGGAETHARLVAEYLRHYQGWDVEVFTTTAVDYETWDNYYPMGTTQVNGVVVHRFPCRFRRFVFLFRMYSRLVSPLLRFSGYYLQQKLPSKYLLQAMEFLWYVLQGPYCPRLLKELQASKDRFDKVFFFTYLYYPTIYGFPLCQEKAVLIPTAHDESPLFFPKSKYILKTAEVLLVNTEAERTLIRQVVDVAQNKIFNVGVGVEANYAKKFKVSNATVDETSPAQPYFLYLGRVSKGKGVAELINNFQEYLAQSKNPPPRLLLAGALEKNFQIPTHPDIHYLGPVSEERKLQLIRNAAALINPSTKESLSLIVLEALAMQKPIIVNGNCQVLNSYCQQVKTVLPYFAPGELHAHLDWILQNTENCHWHVQLKKAQNWVLKNYSWEKVYRSYQAALTLGCNNVQPFPRTRLAKVEQSHRDGNTVASS